MRKFLSFLALLVVGFVLPQWAGAWNYDGNTDISKIEIYCNQNQSTTLLTFDATTKWTGEFVAPSQNITFTVRTYNNSGTRNEYYANYGADQPNSWIEVDNNPQNAGQSFYQKGLTAGATYRIELAKGVWNGNDPFHVRFVPIVVSDPTNLYVYSISGSSATQLGAAVADSDGNFHFEDIEINANTQIILSRNAGATTVTGTQTNTGRYCPTSSKNIPGENIAFTQNNGGYWTTTRTGSYTIDVNWSAKTLTSTCEGGVVDAPASLYLYVSPWVTQCVQAAPSADGIYKYTVNLTEGTHIDLSTVANATNWDGLVSGLYSPGTDTPLNPGEELSFSKASEGAWTVKMTGKYVITVDWAAKTLTVVYEEVVPAGVHMPLSVADFQNGKKHYFLVGERLGEWHLQPEWELTVNGSQAEISDRYFYDGKFAVAVVSTYTDYINHRYTYYATTNNMWFLNDLLTGTLNTSGSYSPAKTQTNSNPTNYLYTHFDTNFGGDQDYYQGRGGFMDKVVLDLDGNGNPSKLTFVPGTVDDSSKNRVFTLVGSNIYNNQFCNASDDDAKTYTYNKGKTTDNGWQEGWIQYDPANNRPYVDGRGEYLYLTSFTPEYMTKNPVRFQQTLADGTEFAYASGQVEFLQWTNLPNLDSDPYKDFYQAFSGTETISNSGATVSGEGYNFKLKTECNDPQVTPTANWECYVVRDMWVAGEVKFWTGWGGNLDYTNGGTAGMCVWHGPNGGPNLPVNTNKQVKGYDINAGLDAVLYKNGRNINNSNYKISDGTPVYFNRVVLWFNNTDGVAKSFIQFIQESAGPAIFAQVVPNTINPDKKNYINYNWYLNESQTEVDKDLQVLAYEIRRYRVVDNVTTFIGYPEGEKVDISSYNVKVQDLYEASAPNYEFTHHLDSGVIGGEGFAPGIYQYDIYVTYEGGARKLAWSNRVTIYDDELVSPEAVAMQLVELRDAYTDKYGTDHKSGYETLGTTKKYLTYRPNDNANFYVLDVEKKDIVVGQTTYNVTLPKNAEIIDAAKAIEFLNNCPDQYWWTSDYYVRCLDYKEYARTLQDYMNSGVMQETEVPQPILQVNERIEFVDAAGNEGTFDEIRGFAQPFDFGDNTYYSMIVKRGGNLADAVFVVQLRYSYTDAEGENRTPQTQAMTQVDPVTPRPFWPLYRYTYERPERNLDADYEWGKILVPTKNWKHADTNSAIEAGDLEEVYVKFDDKFDPRNFTLQVDFYRPNVNEEIYKYYDIQYNVTMDNKDNDVPLNMEAVLHDVEFDEANYPNRYRMEFKGMHPRNGVYPVVKFVKTEYVPNNKFDAVGNEYKSQTGNFGEMLEIECVRSVQINTNPDGLNKVHLGKIQREGGKWDWMYKGHEDFQDEDEVLKPQGTKYEDLENDVAVKPLYYLIEVKTATDEAYYNYLVPHVADHNADKAAGKEVQTHWPSGLIMNDTDPLIGTYIAKGFSTDETPEVYATAIYMFERPVNGNETDSYTNFNRLEVESIVFKNAGAQSASAKPAAAKAARIPSMDQLIQGSVGDLPDVGTEPEGNVLEMSAPDETTGYNAYIAVKGATYSDKSDDTVTGVDDVLAGYEDGEVVWYNLQGIRVAEPTTAGVYMKVQGKNVSKVVID